MSSRSLAVCKYLDSNYEVTGVIRTKHVASSTSTLQSRRLGVLIAACVARVLHSLRTP